MLEFLLSFNLGSLLFFGAIIIVAIDVIIFSGYSWATLLAASMLITSGILKIGLVTNTNYLMIILSIIFISMLIFLWKPLKKVQNTVSEDGLSSDMIGLEVTASADITTESGLIRYSSIDWNAVLATDLDGQVIKSGSKVVIKNVIGTTMHVIPK